MDTTRNNTIDPQNRSYAYKTLEQLHSIRVLRLHPGPWDSPIRCDLSTIDLDSITPDQTYEAVSYAWGDCTERRTITCNGVPFHITKSLFEALQVFRPQEGSDPRVIWADHICINQDNPRERNHQVQLMRMIYSRAAKVLIWLGHNDFEAVEAGLDLVCRVAGKHLKEHQPLKPRTNSGGLPTFSKPPCAWRATTLNESVIRTPTRFAFEAHELPALRPLFGCRWFNRLWVLQEIALASAAEAFWGQGCIDFMLIGLTGLHVFDHCRSEFVQYDPYYGSKQDWGMLRYWTDDWGEVNFIEVLVLTRTLLASDPRDKVFGLLGITASDSDPEGSTFIYPDYSLSIAEVYTAVAKKALLDQKDVNILAVVQHSEHVPENWISWVPDWRTSYTNYLAKYGRKTSRITDPIIEVLDCQACSRYGLGTTVSVRGFAVDVVKEKINNGFEVTHWLQADLPRRLQAAIQAFESRYDEETLAFTLTGGYTLDEDLIKDAATHIAEYKAFATWDLERYIAGSSTVKAPTEAPSPTVASAYRFYANSGPTILRRRLFVTSQGMLGLGPLAMEEGDTLVELFGGTVPFVLRPNRDGKHYRLVGECYVHNIMDGQAIDKWRDSDGSALDFHLY